MNKNLLIIVFLLLSSCSPKVRTQFFSKEPALAFDSKVIVLNKEDSIPAGAEMIGQLKIGDSGFSTQCDYETVISEAKMEARKGGGNIVKIVEHVAPNFGSTCHRIRAVIYKAEIDFDVMEYNGVFDPDAGYALVHVYRHGGMGALIGYNLYLGDSLLCRVKNNFKETFKINTEGTSKLMARTEATVEIPIEIEHGHEYYLRCGVGVGVMVGRPKLELVTPETGRMEFSSIEYDKQGKNGK